MKLSHIQEARYHADTHKFHVGDKVRIYANRTATWTVDSIRTMDAQTRGDEPHETEYWYTLINNSDMDEEIEEPEWELSPASEPHPRD